MSRIRSIKPEFFQHEGLGDLSFAARLYFIGLWTQADREGRLEYRPRRLKTALFPYDDVDIEELTDTLIEAGFVCQYSAGTGRALYIPNFLKHQWVSKKERPSELPEPPEHWTSTGQALDEDRESTLLYGRVNVIGREGNARNAREDTPPLFSECNDALLEAFATILPATQVLKLKRLCSDYDGQTPTALDRIRFGIQEAKRQGKAQPAFAIGCALNAGADEITVAAADDDIIIGNPLEAEEAEFERYDRRVAEIIAETGKP